MKYMIDFTKLHTNSAFVLRDFVSKNFPDADREGIFIINGKRRYISEKFNRSNLLEALAKFQGSTVEIEYLEEESTKYLRRCEEEDLKLREWFKSVASTDEFRLGLKEILDEVI